MASSNSENSLPASGDASNGPLKVAIKKAQAQKGQRHVKSANRKGIEDLISMIASDEHIEELRNEYSNIFGELCNLYKLSREHTEAVIVQLSLNRKLEFSLFANAVTDRLAVRRNPQERCFILRCLEAALAANLKHMRVTINDAKALMFLAMNTLSTSEESGEVIHLFSLIITIAGTFPQIFPDFLTEVCDYALGWLLDTMEGRSRIPIVRRGFDVIAAVSPFLLVNIDKASFYLKNLSDDAAAVLKPHFDRLNDEKVSWADSLVKKDDVLRFGMIVRAFAAFLDASVNDRNRHKYVELIKGPQNNFNEITENLLKLRSSHVCAQLKNVYRVLSLMVQIHSDEASVKMVLKVAVTAVRHPQSVAASVVEQLGRIKSLVSSNPAAKEILIATFFDLKFLLQIDVDNKEIAGALVEVISALLDPADFTRLPKAYTNFVDVLKTLRSNLSPPRSKALFATFLAALQTLLRAKNSLIVMNGISPPLHTLIFEDLAPLDPTFLTCYPLAHLALLHAAKYYSDGHELFVAEGLRLSANQIKQEPGFFTFTTDLRNGKNFWTTIEILTTLMSHAPKLINDTLRLVLTWLIDILTKVVLIDMKIFLNAEQTQILKQEVVIMGFNIVDRCSQTQRQYQRINRFLDVTKGLPVPGSQAATVFWKRFATGFNGLSESKHWKFLSFFKGASLIHPVLNNALGNALEERQGSIHLGSFSVRDFAFLASFLMQQEPPITGKAADSAFTAAGILLRSLSGTAKGRLPVPILASQWRTAVDNLALYCVENRMKTPLGRTNETFTSITASVSALIVRNSDISSSAAPTSDRLQYSIVPADTRHPNAPPQLSPSDAVSSIEWTRNRLRPVEELLRVHSLLSFVSALDKLMAFAERGSIRPFVDVSPGARQFFVTNVEPCQAWVTTRVTMAMLQACQHAGRHAEVVRFAMNVLITTKMKAVQAQTALKYDDFSRLILLSLVRALVELAAPQAIRGVHKYALMVFDTDLEYVWPAMDAAASRFEAALSQIELILSVENSVHEATRAFLHDLRFSVLKKLRNPVLWRNSLNNVSLPPGEAVEIDRRRHEALILAEAIEEPTGGSSRISAGISVPWELERRLDDFELRLMAIHARMGAVYGKTNTRSNRPDQLNEYRSAVDEQMKQISTEIQDYAAAITSLDVSDIFHAKFAALDAIRQEVARCAVDATKTKAVSDRFIDGNFLEDWRIHTTDRIMIGEQLCSWTTKLGSPASYWHAHVAMARLSLKTGNVDTARGHLARLQNAVPPGPSQGAFATANGLRIQPANLDFAVQTAKLSRMAPTTPTESNDAFFRLAQTICAQDLILCSPSVSPAPGMMRSDVEFVDKVQAIRRALLKLGKWVRGDTVGKMAQIDASNRMMPNRLWDSVIKRYNCLLNISTVKEREEPLEGALYWTASEIGTNMTSVVLPLPKAHLHLAEWTHEQLYEEDGSFALTEMEIATLRQIGFDSNHSKFGLVRRLISEIHDFKQFQLELCQEFEDAKTIALVESLEFFTVWHAIKNRQKQLFDLCLRSHLTFLTQFEMGSTTVRRTNSPGSIDTVTATLRILHALVTHPKIFYDAIGGDTWLQLTNERLWTAVIPQLFARLNHPNSAVRKVICDLLSRIGELAPHAICFPAIVGAHFSKSISLSTSTETPGIERDLMDCPYELEEALSLTVDPKEDSTRMSSACLTLVEHLSASYPKLVADVTLFIKELTRINMLHEEKWCFVLNNLDVEMKRRIVQLEAESERTMNSKYLDDLTAHCIIEDRADLFTAGIAEILADLFKSTCGGAYDEAEPETDAAFLSPNERRFRDEFAGELADALDHFVRNRIDDPREAWIPFKKLVTLLNQRSSKKASLSLATSDMSPWLAAMNGTAVPLPGQELCPADEVVTIRSMKEHVSVLLTKTRPKKITFVGSDGKEYVFLFKGQEDLHLDERAMQLLQICNLMLSEKRTVAAGDAWPAYACRHYSVTPLGIRSGLIRWVEGATPMFQIYRKWRQRMVAREAAKNAVATGADVAALPKPPNERPMELFFQQLKTVFGALNLPPEVIQDRKRWPLDALRQVHDDLVKITPRDILSRELWFAAGTADTWWRVTQRFSRSTAAASMIGAVIGLGDRHMENLLIDLASGEVVHIDYNVCFDKGRQLRVPETVPFRLTGNIGCALGPTQTEGTFRQSCEHILSVLRAGRHTLLSMLDAFVYDPLVDWAMADHHAAGSTTVNTNTILAVYGGSDRTTKMSAQDVTLELFHVRMREFRQQWKEASEGLQEVLRRTLVFLPQLGRIPPPTRIRYQENIVEMTKDMHSIIREYSNLAGIFRPLVKALGHTDERFRDYLKSCYAQLSDRLARGFKLMSEGPNFDVEMCIHLFGSVVDQVMEVHDALVKLADIKELRSIGSEQDKQANEPRRLKETENAHAKLISKRIRRRLEGKETLMTVKEAEAGRTSKRLAIDAPLCAEGPEMSPEEQVSMLIASATNPDNLAFMYEGWTAWV